MLCEVFTPNALLPHPGGAVLANALAHQYLGAAHDVQVAAGGKDELQDVEHLFHLGELEHRFFVTLGLDVVVDVSVHLEEAAVSCQLDHGVPMRVNYHVVVVHEIRNHAMSDFEEKFEPQVVEDHVDQPVLQLAVRLVEPYEEV